MGLYISGQVFCHVLLWTQFFAWCIFVVVLQDCNAQNSILSCSSAKTIPYNIYVLLLCEIVMLRTVSYRVLLWKLRQGGVSVSLERPCSIEMIKHNFTGYWFIYWGFLNDLDCVNEMVPRYVNNVYEQIAHSLLWDINLAFFWSKEHFSPDLLNTKWVWYSFMMIHSDMAF